MVMMSMPSSGTKTASVGVAAAAVFAFVLAQWPLSAAQGAPGAPAATPAPQAPAATAAPATPIARPCHARGTIMTGTTPLPGVSVTAKSGTTVVAVTSTDVDGTYSVPLAPGTYSLHVELTGFGAPDETVTVGQPPCDVALDVPMTLGPRTALPAVAAVPSPSATPSATAATPGTAAAPATAPAQTATVAPGQRGQAAAGRGGRNGGAGGRQGAAAAPQTSDTGFQSLSVQQSDAAASVDAGDAAGSFSADDPAARLLPPGFSPDASSDAVAVSGSQIQVDRGQLADRLGALGRGEFGLADDQAGQLAPGFAGAQGGFGGADGGGRGGGPGGRGGGGFGGRLGGANRLQVQANYQLGGSFLNANPYALNGVPQTKPLNAQQSYSTTIGGPVKIPGIYDGSRRTTFNFSYSGTDNGVGYNNFATVPTDAWRTGDFSSSPVAIINPATGQPFPNNQVPVSPTAAALLNYIPHQTLLGNQSNFETQGTSHSTTNGFNIRLTHSLATPPAAGRGGRGGFGGGGFGGRGGGQNGQNGRGAAPATWNVTLNATIGYRRNHNDRIDIFPALDGTQHGSTLSAAETANIRHGRTVQTVTFTFNRTESQTSNPFQFTNNAAADAGIAGVSADTFYYGVPTVQFGSGLTSLAGTTPSLRENKSYQLSYTWTRPSLKHNWRIGTDYQLQTTTSQSDSNPNGTFSYSGLYTGDGNTPDQAFADFLLGLPQTASIQQCATALVANCGQIQISGTNADVYFNDDWRWKPRWTINYGVRYEYTGPYTEANGQMANLDVNSTLTAVAPVNAFNNYTGTFSGAFPTSLVNPDWNNVAPRVGVAWRASNRSVIRFGYGLSYNNGTYANIARNLYQQPPYFNTGTLTNSLENPFVMDTILQQIGTDPTQIDNTYAINKNYQLGLIHQFNFDYSRDLFKTYAVGATYVGTIGRDLDLLLAPNTGPAGLLNPDVPAFQYQTSGGVSHANSVSFRLQKRQSHGVSGNVSYTLQRAIDDTTATSGSPSLAQNAQDIADETALSNFNRTQVMNGTMSIQLPWGKDRHWLAGGGRLAAIVGDWTLSGTLLVETGTPLTARCSLCANELASGVVGTLRADYNGGTIALPTPVVTTPGIGPSGQLIPGNIQFFNAGVFSQPLPGTFGTALRNQIIGPGTHLLNAVFSRDVQLGGNRGVTIQVSVNNLLNTVNYASIDTNVTSATFGQVLSVGAMRSARANLRFRF